MLVVWEIDRLLLIAVAGGDDRKPENQKTRKPESSKAIILTY